MKKAKPYRRLPRPKRRNIIHPDGIAPALLAHRAGKPRPKGAVTASELESDLLAFLVERYAGRHLDIETAQLAISNVAHKLIMQHLRAVAAGAGKS